MGREMEGADAVRGEAVNGSEDDVSRERITRSSTRPGWCEAPGHLSVLSLFPDCRQ